MKLTYPAIITPRLLPGVQIGPKSWVSIEYSRRPGDEGRTRYQYYLDTDLDGVPCEHSGDDIQSGCCGGGLQDGLLSLLSFLGACAESYPNGENAGIFPTAIGEWAQFYAEEISLAALELEETPSAIYEEG